MRVGARRPILSRFDRLRLRTFRSVAGLESTRAVSGPSAFTHMAQPASSRRLGSRWGYPMVRQQLIDPPGGVSLHADEDVGEVLD